MSRICVSYATHMNKSWHTYEQSVFPRLVCVRHYVRVAPYIWINRGTHMNQVRLVCVRRYVWVVPHIWTCNHSVCVASHVWVANAHVCGATYTCEVIRLSHATRMNMQLQCMCGALSRATNICACTSYVQSQCLSASRHIRMNGWVVSHMCMSNITHRCELRHKYDCMYFIYHIWIYVLHLWMSYMNACTSYIYLVYGYIYFIYHHIYTSYVNACTSYIIYECMYFIYECHVWMHVLHIYTSYMNACTSHTCSHSIWVRHVTRMDEWVGDVTRIK